MNISFKMAMRAGLRICALFCGMLGSNMFANVDAAKSEETAKARALLQEGHRVVFLGDSITQAGDFIVDIECWLLAHGIEAEFVNLGLGSETAVELSADENAGHVQAYQFGRPCVSERLERVLKMTKPGLLFVCYGMNDAGAMPADDSGTQRYAQAVTRIRDQALRSGVRSVVLCSPPVHDAKGDQAQLARDLSLTRYSDWLLSKRSEGWVVLDYHTPMRAALDRGRAADPAFAFAADGTHPDRAGHWIMAKEVLQGYFGAAPIGATQVESLFPTQGAEIRALVRDRLDLRFQVWMTHIGHKRPGVAGGPGLTAATDPNVNAEKLNHLNQAIRERIAALPPLTN